MSNSRYFFSKSLIHDIRVTKQGIAEYGFDKFVETTKAQKNECLEILKKSPKGSVSNSSICMKWWRLGDSNS